MLLRNAGVYKGYAIVSCHIPKVLVQNSARTCGCGNLWSAGSTRTTPCLHEQTCCVGFVLRFPVVFPSLSPSLCNKSVHSSHSSEAVPENEVRCLGHWGFDKLCSKVPRCSGYIFVEQHASRPRERQVVKLENPRNPRLQARPRMVTPRWPLASGALGDKALL